MEKIIIKMPYIDKITVSQKRRVKYHHKTKYKPYNIQGKVLGKRYSSADYSWDSEGYLIHSISKEKVIANPKTAGKPKFWVINLQPIYNGNMGPIQRSSYMKILKNSISDWIDIEPILEFPLKLELFLYAELMPIDVDNKGSIYFKAISDILTTKGIIPDDSSEYIRDTGRTVWIPTPKHKEKMEFHITKIE